MILCRCVPYQEFVVRGELEEAYVRGALAGVFKEVSAGSHELDTPGGLRVPKRLDFYIHAPSSVPDY